MPRVAIHPEALADLDAIGAKDPKSRNRLLAALEQVKADPELLDRLTQHDFGIAGTADFHVSRWESQQNKHKRNLWRLKLWDLEEQGVKVRVIYAFEPASHSIFVLGIAARRNFNYEDNEPFTKRVTGCYDRHFSRS